MSVSPALSFWGGFSVWALFRAACPLRRECIDFFPWITRLDRLGCLPEFDCFLSMLAVHTDLRHTHQNSTCLHASVDVFEETALTGAITLHTGRLIKRLMFNQGDWTREEKCCSTNFSHRNQQELWLIKCSTFTTTKTALEAFDSSTFWEAVAVAAGILHYNISREEFQRCVTCSHSVAAGSIISSIGFSTLKPTDVK